LISDLSITKGSDDVKRHLIEGPVNDEMLNKQNSNFKVLFDEGIRSGLDSKDAREKALQALVESTLAKENALVAKGLVQQIIDGSIDTSALNTNIEQRMNDLEGEYAPKLTEVTQRLEETAKKLFYFEAPKQPSFNALDEGHIWDGINRTQDDFRKEMIDPLVATAPDYVTKTLLGKDTSGTYDIHEYIFEPEEYEQTILLTSGVHGRETVPVYSIYRLMHYLINEPEVHPDIQYLREKVRICIIPVVNPWGGSNIVPGTIYKVYGNVNGSSITRNVPFEWELAGTARGTVPFSENEAKIMWDWITKYKNVASFYMDFHTNWSYYGSLPEKDVWVNLTWQDEYAAPVIKQVNSYLNSRVTEKYGRSSVDDTGVTTGVGMRYYAQFGCNIPAATMEYCETRFGGRFGGSVDITEHLTQAVNFISSLSKANLLELRKERDSNFKALKYISTEIMNFHSLNEDINAADFSDEVHEKYDRYVSTPPKGIEVTESVLSKDTSNTYDIKSYTFMPERYEKTLFLYAGLYSRYGFKEVFVLQNLIKYIYTSKDYVAEQLRNYYRIIVIPVVDVSRFNKSISSYDNNGIPDRDVIASDIRILTNDFDAFTLSESRAIKKIVEANVIDTSIDIGSHFGLAAAYAIDELNNIYTTLYNASKYAEKIFNPSVTIGEFGLISDFTGYTSNIHLKYMSKHVIEPVSFRVGRVPFDRGTPIYNENLVEMRRFAEILINSLYQYMTTNFKKTYSIEPVNLAKPFYNDDWDLHANAILLEDKETLKFTPTASYQENDLIIDVEEGMEYYASFDKIIPNSPQVALFAFRVTADGIVGSSVGNTTGKEMMFTIPIGYPKIKLSVRSVAAPYGESFIIKDIKLYKVNK